MQRCIFTISILLLATSVSAETIFIEAETFTLSKYQNKNCTGYVRNVDCVLLTTDKSLTPDHLPYGPQTFLRVTVGDVYEKPVQIHIFADHYRAPWYAHFHLSKAGAQPGLYPKTDQLLSKGEQTPWCNITPMLYQDSGAILNVTARYTYHTIADRLQARFDFASAPRETSIVRTMDVDCVPGGLVVIVPPDLATAENRARLMRDREFAEATGKIADAFDWPTIGKIPDQFPFFVSATIGGYGTPVDQSVQEREWKTLDYFGFRKRSTHELHPGIWRLKEGSYCQPDLPSMRTILKGKKERFLESGGHVKEINNCFLTDEPTGQATAFMANNAAYQRAFRDWLQNRLGKTPADLLVADWDQVKLVAESQRDNFPALYYFTQRFRTRALGDFMVVQKKLIQEEFGREFPTTVNFSDGATYAANFYAQGVDYFELLDDDQQNAILSEDWANGSSSYQCGAYNVDLMRAAARDRGQVLGHLLVTHAGRKSWDIKTKAAGETARGVKMWWNFSYGTSWGSHEGGPVWKSHAWYNHPELWRANSEVVREIGGAEDMVLSAKADPADVAILYSSSSDVWTVKRNRASGFERMHTWMALAHAQIPVDFVSERQVADDSLSPYKVCYLSGPNLTRSAAVKLRSWIERGGTLFLSAGAASRDEYNRPLKRLGAVLPADRAETKTLEPFRSSGKYLFTLTPQGLVRTGNTELQVLSLRQELTPKNGGKVVGSFADGSPAIISGTVGKGRVFCVGFLPALDYIRKAEIARRQLETQELSSKPISDHPTPPVMVSDQEIVIGEPKTRLERSYNPWHFPTDVREMILSPVRTAGVTPPLTCSVPLIDAVPMVCDKGIVIPLANHTLAPIDNVDFTLRVDRVVNRIESIHQGEITFEHTDGRVAFSLPLDASDYVKVYFE